MVNINKKHFSFIETGYEEIQIIPYYKLFQNLRILSRWAEIVLSTLQFFQIHCKISLIFFYEIKHGIAAYMLRLCFKVSITHIQQLQLLVNINNKKLFSITTDNFLRISQKIGKVVLPKRFTLKIDVQNVLRN